MAKTAHRTLDDIRDEVLALSEEERGVIADAIAQSLMTAEERALEREWMDECDRRLADYEAGRTKGIPLDEAMQNIRARLARR